MNKLLNNVELLAKHWVRTLASGASESILAVCEYNKAYFVVKISPNKIPIEKRLVAAEVLSQADNELRVATVLKKQFIDTNATPCIMEILGHCTRDVPTIRNRAETCSKLYETGGMSFLDRIKRMECMISLRAESGSVLPQYNIIASERCDFTLHAFISSLSGTIPELEMYRAILFQIIYTFSVITDKYPSFRHNDLHTENILIKLDYNTPYNPNMLKCLKYVFGKDKYYVPYFNLYPKLMDFGFSGIDEEGIKPAVTFMERWKNDLEYLFMFIDDDLYTHFGTDAYKKFDLLGQIDEQRVFRLLYHEMNTKMSEMLPPTRSWLDSKVFSSYKNKMGNVFKEYEWRCLHC